MHMGRCLLKNMQKKTITMDVILCSHCNLRCKHCNRWANISKVDNYPLNDLKNDILKLKNINAPIECMTLIGGEPLVYPYLLEICNFIHSELPTVNIVLYTNGKGLDKKSDEFWQCMKNCKVQIILSRYPNIDYKTPEKKAKEFNVPYNPLKEIDKFDNCPLWITRFLREKMSLIPNPELAWERKQKCACDVIGLWKGKIYRCPRAALINVLNEKYNTHFISSDYIDVNSSDINILKTFNSYVKWMIEPNKLCEYCIVGTRDYVQWSTDNAEYSDFIVDTYENYLKEH